MDRQTTGYRRYSVRRALWFLLGTVAMLLGIIGIVLPVMPTTPFIIVAAFAFGRSAPVVEQWLHDHRFFGPMIADWRANGAIAPKYKAIAVTTMVGSITLSTFMGLAPVWLTAQAICLFCAAAFVLSRPNGRA